MSGFESSDTEVNVMEIVHTLDNGRPVLRHSDGTIRVQPWHSDEWIECQSISAAVVLGTPPVLCTLEHVR
jgi:hypothetical protein